MIMPVSIHYDEIQTDGLVTGVCGGGLWLTMLGEMVERCRQGQIGRPAPGNYIAPEALSFIKDVSPLRVLNKHIFQV